MGNSSSRPLALVTGASTGIGFELAKQFFETADMLDTKVGADDKDDPADVARDGFEAMMAGKERVVSASLTTKLMGRAGRFVPDSAKAEQHRKMAEPGSAEKS